jgi:hypothetical protein
MHHRCRDFLRIHARHTGMHALPRKQLINRSLIKINKRIPFVFARSRIARHRHAATVTFLNIRG